MRYAFITTRTNATFSISIDSSNPWYFQCIIHFTYINHFQTSFAVSVCHDGVFLRYCAAYCSINDKPLAVALGLVTQWVCISAHDDVIKWKHYWPFVGGIHRSPVNSPQRPLMRSFDVFFDLRMNKRLRKQSWCWWFETLSRPLWRHCNV